MTDLVEASESAYRHRKWTSPDAPRAGPTTSRTSPDLSTEVDHLPGAAHNVQSLRQRFDDVLGAAEEHDRLGRYHPSPESRAMIE